MNNTYPLVNPATVSSLDERRGEVAKAIIAEIRKQKRLTATSIDHTRSTGIRIEGLDFNLTIKNTGGVWQYRTRATSRDKLRITWGIDEYDRNNHMPAASEPKRGFNITLITGKILAYYESIQGLLLIKNQRRMRTRELEDAATLLNKKFEKLDERLEVYVAMPNGYYRSYRRRGGARNNDWVNDEDCHLCLDIKKISPAQAEAILKFVEHEIEVYDDTPSVPIDTAIPTTGANA